MPRVRRQNPLNAVPDIPLDIIGGEPRVLSGPSLQAYRDTLQEHLDSVQALRERPRDSGVWAQLEASQGPTVQPTFPPLAHVTVRDPRGLNYELVSTKKEPVEDPSKREGPPDFWSKVDALEAKVNEMGHALENIFSRLGRLEYNINVIIEAFNHQSVAAASQQGQVAVTQDAEMIASGRAYRNFRMYQDYRNQSYPGFINPAPPAQPFPQEAP